MVKGRPFDEGIDAGALERFEQGGFEAKFRIAPPTCPASSTPRALIRFGFWFSFWFSFRFGFWFSFRKGPSLCREGGHTELEISPLEERSLGFAIHSDFFDPGNLLVRLRHRLEVTHILSIHGLGRSAP